MFIPRLTEKEKEGCGIGDYETLCLVLRRTEASLIDRVLQEQVSVGMIQGAALMVRELIKLIDPSNTTR